MPDGPTTTSSPDRPTTSSTPDSSSLPPPTTSTDPYRVSTSSFVITPSMPPSGIVTTARVTATSTVRTTPKVWTSTFVYTSTIPGRVTSTWVIITSGSLSTQVAGTTTSRGVHSPGAIAGIVIGVLAAISFGAAWLFFARRRLQRANGAVNFDPAGNRPPGAVGRRSGPLDGEDDGPEELLSRRGSAFMGSNMGSVRGHTTGESGSTGWYGHGGFGGGSGEEEMQNRYAGVLAALYPEHQQQQQQQQQQQTPIQPHHTGGSMSMATSMSPSMVMAYANSNRNAQQSSTPFPQVPSPPPVAQRGPYGTALYDTNKSLPSQPHPPSAYSAPHLSPANFNANSGTASLRRMSSPGLEAGAWLGGTDNAGQGLAHTLSVGHSSSGHDHSLGHTHSRSLSGHGHEQLLSRDPSQGANSNSQGHAISSSGHAVSSSSGHGGYPASSAVSGRNAGAYMMGSSQEVAAHAYRGQGSDSGRSTSGNASSQQSGRLNRTGSSQSALLGPSKSVSTSKRRTKSGDAGRGESSAPSAPFKSVKDFLGRLRGGRGSGMSSSAESSGGNGPVIGSPPPPMPIDLSTEPHALSPTPFTSVDALTHAHSNSRSPITSEGSHGGGAAPKRTPTMSFVLSNPDAEPISPLALPLPRNPSDQSKLSPAPIPSTSDAAVEDSTAPAAATSASIPSSAGLLGGSAGPNVPAWPFLPTSLATASAFPSAAPVPLPPVPEPLSTRPGAIPLPEQPTLSSLLNASGPLPSPALSDMLSRTDGLLRPGLLRYGENEGGRSVTTLRDFEDYSRPIGGLVYHRQDSRATIDTRTESLDLSDVERAA
ncbi:hypothetical protein CONPUDRAFT_139326 [Coniophora puteana RWD-64-598 SS2]|uniref:Uncharacterized protein n=1 Tax=Coniophora puteana (strain RWD-64-598) TaxID=741705 RepID=A0A5M3MEV5_CONPW|nr:uncharacterized protein CONPUDRAFT_139326 [Coniophora puteana RWD-64-598 SS2]EIW77450.1 hypothetical protein CONPUDRAFT_139326 [Coniophora puteana RWD-64-598 SS2]